MDLNAVQAFVMVAEQLSYSRAAHASGLPRSFLSRKVQELEESLSTQLFHRTTRDVRLTESGKEFFERCQSALSELNEAQEVLRNTKANPQGHLRITVPVEFGPIFTRYLSESFLPLYPEITVEILATNQVLDFVKDNIDLAIRPEQIADPSLIAIKLKTIQWKLYTSKKWWNKNKDKIKSPQDLQKNHLLGFNPKLNTNSEWKLQLSKCTNKDAITINYQPCFIASSFSVLLEATLGGLGVAAIPEFNVQKHEKKDEFVEVFSDWFVREENILALYLQKKYMPARLRVLLDSIKASSFF